jgi:hypothetical protein
MPSSVKQRSKKFTTPATQLRPIPQLPISEIGQKNQLGWNQSELHVLPHQGF